MNCRFCSAALQHVFADLGSAPPSNAFLTAQNLEKAETRYPLKALVCEHCWLVQVDDVAGAGTHFNADYAYFSSYSASWLKHAEQYVAMITQKLGLNAKSSVCEIASNDGYLLQYFKKANIPCYGVEPTHSTAQAARAKGIETIEAFFGAATAETLQQADLIIGNNVLAHVPDINDFVRGLAMLLKPGGTITLEFPHLMRLIAENQFDTIYHEHYSYLSLLTVQALFSKHALTVYDAEELLTHGGSLRIYAGHAKNAALPVSARVDALLQQERAAGLTTLSTYTGFQQKADAIKDAFLAFLQKEKKAGRTVAGYGAAAKGNTLLNYAGITSDLISFIADANPHKQGRYTPGSHIPITAPEQIRETRPDTVIIFPWNLRHEIRTALSYIRDWNATFVVAVPKLEVFS